MSTYVKSIDFKYLLLTAAALVIACAMIATFWYVPELASGQLAESTSAQPSGFAVPGPIEGPQVFSEADYPYYSSLGQMKKKADAIVKGTVLSVEQRDINVSLDADRDENPAFDSCWVSSVRVDKVIKGDLHEGDIIDVKQVIDGSPIGMGTKSSRGVMFLSQYSQGIPASPINPYQGVVPFVDGVARPHEVDQAMPRGLKEDAFIARLQSAN